MFPTRRQYERWSLPSKWSYWGCLSGLLVGIVSLAISIGGLLRPDPTEKERKLLIFKVAQELRYNREWLSGIENEIYSGEARIPLGVLKTSSLIELAVREHELVMKESYGEEKYIFQLILKLHDLGVVLGTPKSAVEIELFNKSSHYSFYDLIFLNDFLCWYLKPLIREQLDEKQLFSLGRNAFPGGSFPLNKLRQKNMKYFVEGGKAIQEFIDYLGSID